MSNNDMENMPDETGSEAAYTANDIPVFDSAERLSIVEDIVRDICNMIPVIVVSGEAGEGKSTLCRQAVQEIPSEWLTVVFEKNVESFEEVVRQIALQIGCGEVDVSRAGMKDTIDIIGARLVELQKQVAVVFDEAEMIYLATLERTRKMLDQLNEGGVKMQVILCGRTLLLENIKQLSIVNFKEVPEKRYVVEPLSVADVGTYIDHLARIPGSGVTGAFLPAAIEKIHLITGGNISKVRTCAMQVCSSPDREEALEVLLREAHGKTGGPVQFVKRLESWVGAFTSLSRRTQLIGGGVAVLVLLVLLVFSGDDTADKTPQVQEYTIEQSTQAAIPEEGAEATSDTEDVSEETVNAQAVPAQTAEETVKQVVEPQPERQPEEVTVEPQEQTVAEETEPAGSEESVASSDKEVPESESKPEVVVVPPTEPSAAESDVIVSQPEETTPQKGAAEDTSTAGDAPDEKADAAIAEVTHSPQELPADREEGTAEAVEEQQDSSLESSQDVIVSLPESPGNEELQVASQGEEVPLLLNERDFKKLVPGSAPQPAEENARDAESNIIISSLAETEKREIVLISSSPYKIVMEAPTQQEEVAEAVEPVEVIEVHEPEEVQGGFSVDEPAEDVEERAHPPGEIVIPRTAPPVDDTISVPMVGRVVVPEQPAAAAPAPAPAPERESQVRENRTVTQGSILERRMEAGYPWLAGRRNSRYTMQLMMLSSYDAEEKIEAILSQRAYGRASSNFYIFRKNSSPPTYFVFYGEYENKAAADKARNEIPVFLRNHRPYVLSVANAMNKVKF